MKKLFCPNCKIKLERTGTKKLMGRSFDDKHRAIYEREYECPHCGCLWIHDENTDVMRYGELFRP